MRRTSLRVASRNNSAQVERENSPPRAHTSDPGSEDEPDTRSPDEVLHDKCSDVLGLLEVLVVLFGEFVVAVCSGNSVSRSSEAMRAAPKSLYHEKHEVYFKAASSEQVFPSQSVSTASSPPIAPATAPVGAHTEQLLAPQALASEPGGAAVEGDLALNGQQADWREGYEVERVQTRVQTVEGWLVKAGDAE